jgi:hypothetical protein
LNGIELAQDRVQWWVILNTIMILWFPKMTGKYICQLSEYWLIYSRVPYLIQQTTPERVFKRHKNRVIQFLLIPLPKQESPWCRVLLE